MYVVEGQEYIEFWNNAINKARECESISWSNLSTHSNEYGFCSISLDQRICREMNLICKNNNLAEFTLLIAVFMISLSKYSMNMDISVGIPCYRDKKQRTLLVSRVLPVSVSLNNCSFIEYMVEVKNEILGVYKNQSLLNSKILQDNSVNSLLELTPINICMKGLHDQKDIDYMLSSEKNQLSVVIAPMNDVLARIDLIYDNQCASSVDIHIIQSIFINILKSVLKNINIKVSDIEIVSKEEKEHILYDFNNNEMDIPEITISQLFEEQVTKKPES
ncbi:MAG: condensation domain-containing protein, partial [Ruminiclostridium sp.]